jgi:hypothetical protein
MRSPARIALALLLFAAPVAAQELASKSLLPDEPPPSEEKPIILEKPALPDKPAPRGNFFTRPFYDLKITLLAEADASMVAWDDISSREVIGRGGYEKNPLMRPFVHNSGTLAVESVGEVWLMAFVADRMKRSSSPLLRKTWWVPQTVHIAARLSGGAYNTVLLH